MLPRNLAQFASGSLSLEHWLGRDGGDGLSGSEGSVIEVHCYNTYTQDSMSKPLLLIQRQPHAILAALNCY